MQKHRGSTIKIYLCFKTAAVEHCVLNKNVDFFFIKNLYSTIYYQKQILVKN